MLFVYTENRPRSMRSDTWKYLTLNNHSPNICYCRWFHVKHFEEYPNIWCYLPCFLGGFPTLTRSLWYDSTVQWLFSHSTLIITLNRHIRVLPLLILFTTSWYGSTKMKSEVVDTITSSSHATASSSQNSGFYQVTNLRISHFYPVWILFLLFLDPCDLLLLHTCERRNLMDTIWALLIQPNSS